MSIQAQIANLSSEKRKLLEVLLAERGVDLAHSVIVPQDRTTNRFPLSFAQQRLWFLDQLDPGSPLYNIPSAVHVKGPLDVSALERALNEIARRHEILRTTFGSGGGEPFQRIASRLQLKLEKVDLGFLEEARRRIEIPQLASAEAQRPFDLNRGPLIRTSLIRLGPDEHVLLLTLHHIISDGWSMKLLIQEVLSLYGAFSKGNNSSLPDLPLQYADFACWQRKWLKGPLLQEQLGYWKGRLAGSVPLLSLPTDRPRPLVQTTSGKSQNFELTAGLHKRIKRLGEEEGATVFMTLLSAFHILLFRYSGQEDICIGSPIANRNRGEVEGLIGFFANTLVLRTDLSGDPTFRELLGRIKEMALGAYAHQDLPFEILVEELQPKRNLSYSPLFQVMFAFQTLPQDSYALPDLTISPFEADSQVAKFDITLSLAERSGGIQGSFEYNSDLFDSATIVRMIRQFKNLLEAIVVRPETRISDLTILTNDEQELVLQKWNETSTEDVIDRCVHNLIEHQAESTPDAVALIHNDQRLTYSELNSRSNQLAHYLRSLGVLPETLVGICMNRSLEMVIGLVGILKAGGAYIPLDPNYPKERLSLMTEDARISFLLTRSTLDFSFYDRRGRVVTMDTDGGQIGLESEENPGDLVQSRNLAYVLFTSGSTGRPKGIAIEHRSAVALFSWAKGVFSHEELSGVLGSTSISWDLSVFELFTTLGMGGTVILAENAIHLKDLPAAEKVSLINTVPSAISELLTLDAIPSSTTTINLAGEPLSSQLVDQLYQLPWIERVYDLYGPGEDTTYSTFALRSPGGPETIGRPISNSRIYLLDDHMHPVPIGVPGELYIGGSGLARGYLNRPDLTAERFVPNPFTPETGARLYRTGDLARYRPDGNMEFLGRMDYQVKIRGFRIELGEVENALNRHPDVENSVVLARDLESGEKTLAAYVVIRKGGEFNVSGIRRFLKDHLPPHMVPSSFAELETLPLTPNGKVNRNAMPDVDFDRSGLESLYVAPNTPVEKRLTDIWAEVLGVKQVGIHDDFFDLGGHSLLATQLLSRVRNAFGIDMPVRDLFESSTVASMAEKLGSILTKEKGCTDLSISPVPRDRELPLSFAQQRLWFLDQFDPNSPLYNIPSAFRITGKIELQTLRNCLQEIIQRHEILRTRFSTNDGVPVQIIVPSPMLPFSILDLTSLNGFEREREASMLATEEAQRPFDLSVGPLVRALVLTLGEEDHILLTTMHHIVSDGWSTSIFQREMVSLYDAFSRFLPSPLPELPIQYADFAFWQRKRLQREFFEAQLNYWKAQLKGVPSLLELPTDRPRPPVQTYAGDRCTFSLPLDLSERVKRLSQLESATLFMTLLAAFQALLYRYTGQEDVCVGTPIANRNRAEIEGLIGFFVNTLVLRAGLSDTISFRELLSQVRETALEAYAHQDLPFEAIVDALEPQRNLSHNPLFQVMFSLQSSHMQGRAPSLSDLAFRPVEVHSSASKFDLTLSMMEGDECLSGAVEYNTDLFDRSTIGRMIGHFEVLLGAAVENPDLHLSELPVFMEHESRQLILTWNDTAADFPKDRCFHHCFEEQVEKTPDGPAVFYEGQQLTYGQLNRRANQVANYLRNLGVREETIVGLCLERSVDMIVSVMGILKAGGTYLPLDPSYPGERLVSMMDDARATILLTREGLLSGWHFHGVRPIFLDRDRPVISEMSVENPLTGTDPKNLAYIIYTSGSTGRPKGVMIPHRSMLHLAAALNRIVYRGNEIPLRIGFNAPLSFDASVQQLVMLLYGHTLYLIPQEIRGDGKALLEYVRRNRLDALDCVPTQLKILLKEGLSDDSSLWAPSLILPGGEPIDEVTWLELADFSLTEFFNMYGPTECTVDSTVARIQMSGKRPMIGRPVSNVTHYILDGCLQPVPIGVVGELHIGGEAVGRGYHDRADLTAEKFIPDPFSGEPGGRLYKTGDLVRYRPDGNLECLGRVDHQVKIRGFRIELGEIEAVLSEHPDLKDVTVWPWEEGGRKRVAAYVVSKIKEVPPDTDNLRSFLRQRLPDYMIPSAFIFMDELPLTPNRKVDRRALPPPEESQAERLKNQYVEPTTPEEIILAGIWADVLGIEKVGIHDNFFELGGDSILSIQVIARANQAGLRLTPRKLFEAPTVAELAMAAGKAPAIQAEQGIVEGPVPLTPIMHWFFSQDLPEPHHFNQSILFEVGETLDPRLLKEALGHLLVHHDALRLRFKQTERGWEARNAGVDPFVPFEWVDLSSVAKEGRARGIEARAAKLQASLDLTNGPLMRVAYFHMGEGTDLLLIIVHHLAMDGISWRVMLEDLITAYMHLKEKKAIRLPPKTTSYLQWSTLFMEDPLKDGVEKELPFWLDMLQGELVHVPSDFSKGKNTEDSARRLEATLSPEETRSLLREASGVYRINHLLLAALARTMTKWMNSDRVLIDLEGHGREDQFEGVDLSRTVGWFTALYPFLLTVKLEESYGESLRRIKDQMSRVPFGGMNYGRLRDLICKEMTKAFRPIPEPQICFNYLGQFDMDISKLSLLTPSSLSRGEERSPRGIRKHLIEINGGVIQQQLRLEWTYSVSFHDPSTIERLSNSLQDEVRGIILHCQSPDAGSLSPSDFPISTLSQEELERVLETMR